MATDLIPELERFHHFVGEMISNGGADLSPEEVLDEWRAQHPTPEEFADSVAAIRKALAGIEAGDKGRPVEDVIAELRHKYDASDNG